MWVRTFKEEGTAQTMALRLEYSGKGELMIWWAEDMAEQVSRKGPSLPCLQPCCCQHPFVSTPNSLPPH